MVQCPFFHKYSARFTFFVCLFIFYGYTKKILTLYIINILSSLIFLARLFVSLQRE